MKKIKKTSFIFVLLFCAIMSAGCSVQLSTKKSTGADPSSDGGVFVSADKGVNWKQMALVPTVKGAPDTIRALNTSVLTMDPSDPKAVYLGSAEGGLYYTYNILEGWNKASGLPGSGVASTAIDPKDKCRIYASVDNKVFKSEDCNRTWTQIYFDDDKTVKMSAIAVDHYSSANLYIGNSRGDVLKSTDSGTSWQPILRGQDDIKKIMISSFDSRIIFAATEGKGIYRSKDAGMTWENMEDKLKEFKNSKKFRDIEIAKDKEGMVFLATTYGLLRTEDYGDTWTKVELLTPDKESTINAIALNPSNSDDIFYVTDTTFYRSSDGGKSWTTINLPTSRSGMDILISPDNPDLIYLGVKTNKK